MRTAITLGFRHGGTPVEVVALPTVPFVSQKSAFKLLRQSPTHPQFERVEIWDSGAGRAKVARFQKPAAKKPAEKPAAKKPAEKPADEEPAEKPADEEPTRPKR